MNFTINRLMIYEKENKNHSPYFLIIFLLKLKFTVKNFNNKKNRECIPINPPVIKSYNNPNKIIKILEASLSSLLIVKNRTIAKIYGCEITKKDRKFRDICKKQANKIISVKIRLLKINSELNFSIEIDLIAKFIKSF